MNEKELTNSIKITRWIYRGVITALITILLGSASHLAYAYSVIETHNGRKFSWVAWILAIGIEIGMITISFIMAYSKRRGEKTTNLWWSLGFFAGINFFCNTYFALSSHTSISYLEWKDVKSIDYLILTTVVILSSSLPALTITLTEIQSVILTKLKLEEIALKTFLTKEAKEKELKDAKEKIITETTSVIPYTDVKEEKPKKVYKKKKKKKPVKTELVKTETKSYEIGTLEEPVVRRRRRVIETDRNNSEVTA